jgi:hypothetical protein
MTEMMFKKLLPNVFKYTILQSRSLPHIALVFAIAYLLYVAISIILVVINPKPLANFTAEAEQPYQEEIESKQIDLLAIKDWHLFGQAPSVANQISDQNAVLAETQLQIKLLGVFFLPDQKNASYAIIEVDDKSQKKYRQGDELPGGIILQSIAKEQVILLRNNQRESLSMNREKIDLLPKTKENP